MESRRAGLGLLHRWLRLNMMLYFHDKYCTNPNRQFQMISLRSIQDIGAHLCEQHVTRIYSFYQTDDRKAGGKGSSSLSVDFRCSPFHSRTNSYRTDVCKLSVQGKYPWMCKTHPFLTFSRSQFICQKIVNEHLHSVGHACYDRSLHHPRD